MPLDDGVGEDRGEQRVPEKSVVRRLDEIGDRRRNDLAPGALVGDVVSGIESAQRLPEHEREQRHDHPSAGPIAPDLAVALATKEMRELARRQRRPTAAGMAIRRAKRSPRARQSIQFYRAVA
jgi:hypothetical protein